MHRFVVALGAVALVSGFLGVPTAAAQQSVSFYIGGFTPRALDARSNDDVLVQNNVFLSTLNQSRGIDIGQFNGVTVGGEWLFGMTRRVEGGLGIGFYQQTVPTLYTDLVNINGTNIQQDLKLRIVPSQAVSAFCRSATAAACSLTSAPASACTTGGTARPGSSSISRTTCSPAISSAAAAPSVP